jgi:hypothetical protein
MIVPTATSLSSPITSDKPTCRYKSARDLRKPRRGAVQMSGLSLVPGERRGWRLLQIRFAFSEIHAFDQAVCDGIDMPNLTI